MDIKGELCDLTAKYRQKKFKNKIFVFNPLGDDNTLKFNPFDKKIVSQLDYIKFQAGRGSGQIRSAGQI
ncbi:hypothetical protein HSHS1_18910 (plasmid) [Helicobacter suis HS1]|nr:hypothetical protein HSHS1_18910 [Helicobacter suis HS1]